MFMIETLHLSVLGLLGRGVHISPRSLVEGAGDVDSGWGSRVEKVAVL